MALFYKCFVPDVNSLKALGKICHQLLCLGECLKTYKEEKLTNTNALIIFLLLNFDYHQFNYITILFECHSI